MYLGYVRACVRACVGLRRVDLQSLAAPAPQPPASAHTRSISLLQVTQIEIPDLDNEVYGRGGQADDGHGSAGAHHPHDEVPEDLPEEEHWLGPDDKTASHDRDSLWQAGRHTSSQKQVITEDPYDPVKYERDDGSAAPDWSTPYGTDSQPTDTSATRQRRTPDSHDTSATRQQRRALDSPGTRSDDPAPRALRKRDKANTHTSSMTHPIRQVTTVSPRRVDRRQMSKTNFTTMAVKGKEKPWEEMGTLPLEPYSQKALDQAHRMTTREQFEIEDDALVKPKALKALAPDKKQYFDRMAQPRKPKTYVEQFSFQPEIPKRSKTPVWKPKKKGKATFDPTEYARKRKEAIEVANIAKWQPSQWASIPPTCYKPANDAHHEGQWD
jgi:hypothetical protein